MPRATRSRSIRHRVRPLARLLLATAGLLGGAADSAVAADAPTEYQVKAAFLLNFTRFVSWPAGEFAGPNSTLNICVMGDDPFGPELDQLVQGESAAGHRIQVFRVSRRPAVPCQVIFMARDEKDKGSVIMELGPGVLTVSDGEGFLREGGMVAFVMENRHVRFEINQNASDKAGLKVSSKLLSVARFVER